MSLFAVNSRLSFEFFSVQTPEGVANMVAAKDMLQQFAPDFYSVTYGAGGSTRDRTRDNVLMLAAQGVNVAPHLSFGDDDKDVIQQMLSEYKAAGIRRIVALRGDTVSGSQVKYASDLVLFIRDCFGDYFEIDVAAYPEIHPESKSYKSDVSYLKMKFICGANSAITQYFFNEDAYYRFADRCYKAGITQPIYPGIMPIINYKNLCRFSENCGAEIPRWLKKSVEDFGGCQASLSEFSTDFISRMSENLLKNGAPGLHFYTMNQAQPVINILRNISV